MGPTWDVQSLGECLAQWCARNTWGLRKAPRLAQHQCGILAATPESYTSEGVSWPGACLVIVIVRLWVSLTLLISLVKVWHAISGVSWCSGLRFLMVFTSSNCKASWPRVGWRFGQRLQTWRPHSSQRDTCGQCAGWKGKDWKDRDQWSCPELLMAVLHVASLYNRNSLPHHIHSFTYCYPSFCAHTQLS